MFTRRTVWPGKDMSVHSFGVLFHVNVHYYMQFFPGVDAVGSLQPVTLCRALADRGHRVTVLSTDYNLDTGQPEESACYSTKAGGECRILRIWSPRGGRGGLAQRLLSYLWFMRAARRHGARLERPDVVVGSIQPLFTGWAAWKAARCRGVPFVLEVRDLWPDALEVKGAVAGWQAKPLHRMARRLYRSADRIVSITPGIKKEIIKKGVKSPVDVFPNGFDPQLFESAAENRESLRARYGWGEDLVAIYTGSHTKVASVDTIVRAAHVLRDRRNIRFELFGQGPTKDAAVGLARELGLGNIHFHPAVPKSEIPSILAAADLAVMCLLKTPLSHIYFQNKFMDYLGSGKPILASMEGEQAEIIQKQRAGRTVPSRDPQGLARLIAEAADDPSACVEMGKRGRQFVYENLLLPDILAHYADALEAVAAGNARAHATWEPNR